MKRQSRATASAPRPESASAGSFSASMPGCFQALCQRLGDVERRHQCTTRHRCRVRRCGNHFHERPNFGISGPTLTPFVGVVSVCCPTMPSRQRFHPILYDNFLAQEGLPGGKELVVCDSGPGGPSPFFSQLDDPRVKYEYEGESRSLTLGEKRNICMERAAGDLVVLFDDGVSRLQASAPARPLLLSIPLPSVSALPTGALSANCPRPRWRRPRTQTIFMPRVM